MGFESLTKTEKARLQILETVLDWHFTNGITAHFNKAGKIQEFAAEATVEEKQEQKKLLRSIFLSKAAESSFAAMKNQDIFVSVARRVGSDEELATCVPNKDKLRQDDVALLEKCGFKSTAAVVRASLKLG